MAERRIRSDALCAVLAAACVPDCSEAREEKEQRAGLLELHYWNYDVRSGQGSGAPRQVPMHGVPARQRMGLHEVK